MCADKHVGLSKEVSAFGVVVTKDDRRATTMGCERAKNGPELPLSSLKNG
jgi:hypothetical protein